MVVVVVAAELSPVCLCQTVQQAEQLLLVVVGVVVVAAGVITSFAMRLSGGSERRRHVAAHRAHRGRHLMLLVQIGRSACALTR